MRLEALDIRRLPGIEDPFQLRPGPGVNLVVGPNASGKSSVARAVRDLLWPARHAGGVRWLRAVFRQGGAELVVTSDGPAPGWFRDGTPAAAPPLPPPHLADCYRLTAADLLGEANRLDRGLAAAIRTEMTGGFDLDSLARDLDQPSIRGVRERERALREARNATAGVERTQAELATRRDGLAELEARIAAAEAAGRRRDALISRREAAAAERLRREARTALEAFPPVMAAVRADDAESFARLLAAVADRRRRADDAAREADGLERGLAELRLPAGLDVAGSLTRAAALAATCRESARTSDLAAERRSTLARTLQAAGTASTGDAPPHGAPVDTLAGLHRGLADLDANLAALDAELGGRGAAAPGGRRRAVALLGGAGLLAVLTALPVLPSTTARLVCAAAALALAGLGAAGLAAWSGRRVLAEQQVRLAATAAEARARRDELAARAADLAAAEAAAGEAEGRLAADLKATGAAFAPWGLPTPATAGEADASLAELRERVRRHGELTAQLTRAARDRDEAGRDADTAAAQLTALLQRLELPPGTTDIAPVQALVDRLGPWRAADDAWRTADAACAGLAREAARRAADAGLPPDAGPDPEAAIADAETEAARAPGLREQLGSLRQELRTADLGHTLAEALAREQAAADDLAAWRDAARDALAEAALLHELRERHDTLAAPPRLREANRLLGEFTQGRYALVLAAGDDGPVFSAEDLAAGRRLQLAELSDGTRTQVLLAARVAFVSGAESGARPPLFLDEALTTSDPRRMAAVVGSLGRLAEATGRQVFYLTSQPADVGAWRGALAAAGLPEPTILDLAVARGVGTAAAPDQLAPAAAPEVPKVAGRGEADYGALLGVAALDPRRPWQEVDTFHLAAPDLDLARRLRVAGLVAAGPLAAALPRLAHIDAADAAQQARLGRGLAVLRALLPAWRVGRPRPVEIADIDAGGAVSDVFRTPALELLKATDWNGARFLAAVEAGALPRFQARKLDALRGHLADAGCLDDRAPLAAEQLVTEVLLRTGAAPHKEARTSPEEVRALVHRLLRAVPQEIAEDPASRPSSGSGQTG